MTDLTPSEQLALREREQALSLSSFGGLQKLKIELMNAIIAASGNNQTQRLTFLKARRDDGGAALKQIIDRQQALRSDQSSAIKNAKELQALRHAEDVHRRTLIKLDIEIAELQVNLEHSKMTLKQRRIADRQFRRDMSQMQRSVKAMQESVNRVNRLGQRAIRLLNAVPTSRPKVAWRALMQLVALFRIRPTSAQSELMKSRKPLEFLSSDYYIICDLVDELEGIAQTKTTQIQNAINDLRLGTYQTWQVTKLLNENLEGAKLEIARKMLRNERTQ